MDFSLVKRRVGLGPLAGQADSSLWDWGAGPYWACSAGVTFLTAESLWGPSAPLPTKLSLRTKRPPDALCRVAPPPVA